MPLQAVVAARGGPAGPARPGPVFRPPAPRRIVGVLPIRRPGHVSPPSPVAVRAGDDDTEEDGFSISVDASPSSADLGVKRRRRRKKTVTVEVERDEAEDGSGGDAAAAAAAVANAAAREREAAAAAAAEAEAAAAEEAAAAAAAAKRRKAAAARAARQAAEAEAADGFSVSVSAPAEEASSAAAAAAPAAAPAPPASSPRRRKAAAAAAAKAGVPGSPPSSSSSTAPWKSETMADTAAAVNEVGAGRAWRHPVRRTVQRWKDMGLADKWAHAREAAYKRVVWEWEAPNTGTMHLSYARLLDLLAGRNVARLTILGRGRVALVEVPVEGYANDLKTPPSYDRFDTDTMHAPAGSRDALEVNRFYVDLPGDVWARGTMMRLARDAAVPVLDAAGRPSPGHARVYDSTTTDVAVLEPLPRSEVVALVDTKGSMALWLLAARAAALAASWVGAKLSPPDNPEDETAALMRQLSAHTAIEYNTAGKDGKRDTGVRYADVAGVEPVMATVREYMALLTGAAAFSDMGARAPRGLIFEGPPGTGKTLLAKAMAGEAGLPFFACNGAEFVEMYEGVAAARVRDLFKVARAVAPSIIFIDEIDALARARGDGPSDPGSQEREQALLALLVEMDGFVRGDPVLCIGATNLADSLDQALVRPGRFDRTLHLGLPSEPNRVKILAVHAAGKPLDRGGDDALLRRAAAKTIGWSGAELANLMNEAAILMVRHGVDAIGWPELAEAIHRRGRTAGASDGPEALAAAVAAETEAEAVAGGPETGGGEGGPGAGALGPAGAAGAAAPAAAARARLATVVAARAVGAALTAGLPRLEAASLHSRTPGALAALRFEPTEFGTDGQAWARLGAPRRAGAGGARAWPNATPELVAEAAAAAGVAPEDYIPTPYEVVAGLIVALYVPRAAEVELCGGEGAASTSTLAEAASAATLASWLAGNAMLHPRRRLAPVPTGDPDAMGNPDGLTEGAFGPGDAAAATALRDAAWARARALVRAREPAIRAAAAALLGEAGAPAAGVDSADSDGDEDGRIPPGTISGARVVALIRTCPAGQGGPNPVGPPAWLGAARAAASSASGLAPADVSAALESVAGSLALQDLAGLDGRAAGRALAAAGLSGGGAGPDAAAAVAREAAVRRFATTPGAEDGPLPPPPPVLPEYRGAALAGWAPGGDGSGLAIPSLAAKGGGGGGGRGGGEEGV